MKINLGCADRPSPGFLNVDKVMQEGVDVVADLEDTWPWPDNSVEHLRAFDLIEHLHDKIHTMNEAWRVLQPGGVFEVGVPTTDGPGAWQDPTHVSFWHRNSFDYYLEGHPCYTRFAKPYGIKACFRVLSERQEGTSVPYLRITLQAVK